MKNYNNLTLKQLEVEGKKITRKLAFETILSKKQNRPPEYEPILADLKLIEEILFNRVNKPVRLTLTKSKQRKLGILPKLDVI